MAAWELHDGTEQIGPLDEEHVLRMIGDGLSAKTMIRPVGKETWKGLRSYAPFAMAVEAREGVQPAPDPPAPAPAVHAPQPFQVAPKPHRAPESVTTWIGVGLTLLVFFICGIGGLQKACAPTPVYTSSEPFRAPPDPPPARPDPPSAPRRGADPPPVGEQGYLFYPDKNVMPVFPVLGDFETFRSAIGTDGETAAILRSKLVPVRTRALVLKDTGQMWVKVKVMEGKFEGIEGYTFRNAVFPKMPN